MTTPRNAELLFIKSVKDGIPNRDPLADSDARRIFDEDDGRISLSDVSVKRDVRDYVLAKYPDGGPDKNRFIFVREERTDDGKLLGRDNLAKTIWERAGITPKDNALQQALLAHAFDARAFGAVFSVKKASFHVTGPVQFGWAHSLHPVQTQYIQGTVVMPSKDETPTKGEKDSEGKTQGTIWTSWITPFALFAMPGIINHSLASQVGLTEDDVDLLIEGLWYGTLHRQARGRGMQAPLLLIHVEYVNPFFRLGYLEDSIRVELASSSPTSLDDVTLDLSPLQHRFNQVRPEIARIRVWHHPMLRVSHPLDAEYQQFGA
ncbi:MAG: type I CRISPR-associated protein Cas7 [Firmicutes bacterium]|nr:type I CRISPR-associated protein Cas7 [Bacillota bacterium]